MSKKSKSKRNTEEGKQAVQPSGSKERITISKLGSDRGQSRRKYGR